MNPYFYLFYRFNRFLNKKGDNEWGPIAAMTLFPGWNIGLVYITFLPVTKENFDGAYKITLIIILCSLFALNSFLFLNKKRVSRILEHYRKESLTNAKIGSLLVILYILVSLGLLFL